MKPPTQKKVSKPKPKEPKIKIVKQRKQMNPDSEEQVQEGMVG